MHRLSLLIAPSVLAVLCAPVRAGNVLVVGPGPQQLAEIQAAVDAALDDDVILVRSGTYQSFVVANKALTIAADVGQTVNVQGAIRARGLTADRTLVLSGLRATGQVNGNPVEGNGLFLKNCAGLVRVQGCVLTAWSGAGAPCGTPVRHGAEIEGCAGVSFVGCTLAGTTNTGLDSTPGGWVREGHGLVATDSSVSVHDSALSGGRGALFCGGLYAGYDAAGGGHGAVLHGSELFVSGSTVRGGDGGNASLPQALAGAGGAGLVLSDALCVARRLQSTILGGNGGTNHSGCGLCGTCCDGVNGVPTQVATGAVLQSLAGTRRALGGPYVARELTTIDLTVQGVSGDLASVAIRRAAGFAFDPVQSGVVLTGGPAPPRYRILGTLAGAALVAPLPLTAVPGTSPGQRYFLQSLHIDAGGQRWLGSPLTLTVLDSAY